MAISQSMTDSNGPMLWDIRNTTLAESLNEVEKKPPMLLLIMSFSPTGYSAVRTDSHLMELLLLEMRKADNWP
ncbi:MAG: hypothetical protein P8N51_12635 [Pseudomonadales bacterium]|nr:hypothetical protein [Pseudomonadales bacterium]MDG1443239.1 hypothetical protein [Pseudomonadales bacterium]